jgi:hypothetical protein
VPFLSRRLYIPTAWVRVQVRSCGICGAGFLRVLWFLLQLIPPTTPRQSSSAHTIGQMMADESSGFSLTPRSYNNYSGDGSFYPSTQRQYRRLIYYYIILLHVSVVFRSCFGRTTIIRKNILIARVSQLTTDALFIILLTL